MGNVIADMTSTALVASRNQQDGMVE